MPIDMQRPLVAALQAALDEIQAQPPKKQKRPKVGAGRALMLGAGLYTAGRVVANGRGRGMLDAIQHRLPGQDHDDVDEGDVVDEDFDEELDEDEPQGEVDDEEPEADAGEEEPAGEADDESEPDEENLDDEAPAPRRTRGRSKAQSRR